MAQAGSDTLAVGLMANEDREALFRDFVREHRQRAIGLAYQLTGGDRAAAEDVAQEAFLRAYRGLSGFRAEAKLSTWFYRILVRQAHSYRRWRRVRGSWTELTEALVPRAEPEPVADRGLQQRLQDALDGLPRGQREAFVLIHVQGFTVVETAELLGKAVGTVKSHLHRALARLRDELGDLRQSENEETSDV